MAGDGSAARRGGPDAGEASHGVFLAWERLRIPYNAATACTLLAYGGQLQQLGEPWFFRFCLLFGFLTNVAFCVGPCAEGYLSWMGLDRRGVRLLLFVSGTLLACVWCVILLTEKELHPEAPNLAVGGRPVMVGGGGRWAR